MQRVKDLVTIINHFGNENQVQKAVEELAELIAAISANNSIDVIEEIADVQVMLNQLKIMFNCENAVEKIYDEKVDRTLSRINQDKHSATFISNEYINNLPCKKKIIEWN
jgi:phosphoribosyl-ATP pyrophosphohydrolase